ncbi:MAG: hypothetical protein U0002_16430 [Thermoanaerobaculia bacterium]
MNLSGAVDLARVGRLYPSIILHGASEPSRQQAAVEIARTLLCESSPAERPCGRCRHCRRILWPGDESEGRFHPDFHVLLRDLKTATSVDAARTFLRAAQAAPFEARGQIFVVANAETLSGEAADSLLKTLEEPIERSPRHFLLLAGSRHELSATLRSRSLSLYLGPAEAIDSGEISALLRGLAPLLGAYAERGSAVLLLAAAELARKSVAGWEEPRSSRPWATTAAAFTRLVASGEAPPSLRRPLLALAQELLRAPALRLRGIGPERILEGLIVRHLGPGAS